MCFKQVLGCRWCLCSSDVQRQTVPRSRTNDGECSVAELAPGAWNEEVTTGCRAERVVMSVIGTHCSCAGFLVNT